MLKKMMIFMCSLLLISVVACDNKTADDNFIEALQTGLSERWALEFDEKNNDIEKLNNIELEKLKEFKNASFEDSNLATMVNEYIAYLETDASTKVRDGRVIILKEINDIIPLTFTKEADQKRWEVIIGTAEKYLFLNNLIDTIEFKYVSENADGLKAYQATAKNESLEDYEDFEFEIELKDEAGNVLETVNTEALLWKKGKTVTFTFYSITEFASCNAIGISNTSI